MDTDTIYPWLFKTNTGTAEGVKKAWETRHAQGEIAKEEPKSTRTPRPKQVDELFSSYDKLSAGIDIINKKINELQSKDAGNPEKPKLLKQFSELKKARDQITSKVYDHCSTEFNKIAPKCYADFNFFEPKLAYDVVEHAKTLHSIYPGAMSTLVSFSMGDTASSNSLESGTWAEYNMKRHTIKVSNSFSRVLKDSFQKDLIHSEETNFHPTGCSTPEFVITHEFGHHVEQMRHDANESMTFAELAKPRVAMDDMWGGVKSSHPDIPDWTPEDEINDLMVVLNKYPPSEYAKKNKSECWAESFASAYHTPPDKQTPEVKRLAELMNTPYWKKMWEKPL